MEIYGFVGTKEYAAPEMWAEPYVHGREIDYWALGCVAYELLSRSHSVLFANVELRRREFYAYGGKVLPFTITDLSVDAHAFISTVGLNLSKIRAGAHILI
jgi:serine/threonine protein kinase